MWQSWQHTSGWWSLSVFLRCFPRCPPVNLNMNLLTVYNHMDAVIICWDWDPVPSNIKLSLCEETTAENWWTTTVAIMWPQSKGLLSKTALQMFPSKLLNMVAGNLRAWWRNGAAQSLRLTSWRRQQIVLVELQWAFILVLPVTGSENLHIS